MQPGYFKKISKRLEKQTSIMQRPVLQIFILGGRLVIKNTGKRGIDLIYLFWPLFNSGKYYNVSTIHIKMSADTAINILSLICFMSICQKKTVTFY